MDSRFDFAMWEMQNSRVRLQIYRRRNVSQLRQIAVAHVAIACVLISPACGDNIDPGLAWGVGVARFELPTLARVDVTTRISIPTYEHSGQVVHPDILVEDDRYLLAYTPYPYSDGRYENPSIAISDDGYTFREVAPGVNPLAPAPATDHNDDPDLRFDAATGEYAMLYLETRRPDYQLLVELRSRDLVTWAGHTAITYDLTAGAPFIVSPAVLGTSLYDVRLGDPHVLERLDEPWDWRTAQPLAIDMQGITPWHVDALPLGGSFALLISGFRDDFTHQDLYLATSHDLVTWTLREEPLLAFDDPALGVETLYRSTGAVIGGELVVWYSMQYAP